MVTDSKAGKAEVGSRRSNTGKKLRCDIEGTSCTVLPTFARLGATIPTRCIAHKMPDMVAKQPDPTIQTQSAAASKAADQPQKKSAAKQVTFHGESLVLRICKQFNFISYSNTVLILTTINNLYSERERNILEYTHVCTIYDHLKKCVRREPAVSIFHFFWQTNTVHFFWKKNTVYTEILWAKKVLDSQMVSFPASDF